MLKKNLVSIIIPTYNRADLICETLDSVIAQTYENWECIVVDDGSTDSTFDLLDGYIKKDSRFKCFSRPKDSSKGASSCRNIGFHLSNGNYIQYLDSDDILSPSKLKDQLQVISASKNTIIACCKWALFHKKPKFDSQRYNLQFQEGEYSACTFFKQMGELNAFFPPHCFLVPRKFIKNAGDWDENLTNNDDAEFFTRVIIQAGKVKLSHEILAYYRKSGSGHLSNYSDRTKIESVIRSWELINSYISNHCDEASLIYIINGKKRLFHTLKNKYPLMVGKHQRFFHKQLEVESYRLNKIFIFKKMTINFLKTVKQKLLKNR